MKRNTIFYGSRGPRPARVGTSLRIGAARFDANSIPAVCAWQSLERRSDALQPCCSR